MKSTITIDVEMNENRVPEAITWHATESTIEQEQKAKAFMLSLWDGAEKAALRIDLWTEKMMVDEMADFFFQTLMTMADTYGKATNYSDQAEEMKNFAKDFYQKFQAKQMETHKA